MTSSVSNFSRTILPVVLAFLPVFADGQVSEVQRAAERGDVAAFRAALGRLRERPQNDQAVLAVYEDLERLWRYQTESPEGAFFDDSSGLVEMLNRYPGYRVFIAGRTVRGSGTTFYPARESREFLIREAAIRAAGRTKSAEVRETAAAPVSKKSKKEPSREPAPKTGSSSATVGAIPLPVPAATPAAPEPSAKAAISEPRVTMSVEPAAPASVPAPDPSSSAGPGAATTSGSAEGSETGGPSTTLSAGDPAPDAASVAAEDPPVAATDLEPEKAPLADQDAPARTIRNIGVSVFLVIAGIALFVAFTRAAT